VDEQTWHAGTDLAAMHRFVREREGERKLRLLACAYLRQVWNSLREPSRRAVEAAEDHADGLLSPADWQRAVAAAEAEVADQSREADRFVVGWYDDPSWSRLWEFIVSLALSALRDPGLVAADEAFAISRQLRGIGVILPADRVAAAEKAFAISTLWELFGNPFRPPVIHPDWLTWDGAAVPKIARAIYEGRAFDRMAILADALEEAGCGNAELLGHCRGGGEHVRGCWVLDCLRAEG
jgi:hypothetical protein